MAVQAQMKNAGAGIEVKRLKCCVGGQWRETASGKYMPIYNPSTGQQIAEAPCCTADEVNAAVAAAARAFPAWAAKPIPERIQIMFKFKQLLDEHLDELTLIVATENGKVLSEARGDVDPDADGSRNEE